MKEAFFFTFRKYTSVGEVMECFLTILKENNNKVHIFLYLVFDVPIIFVNFVSTVKNCSRYFERLGQGQFICS